MSNSDPRRERISKRISESQDRLKRDNEIAPDNSATKLRAASPPENYRGLLAEYPLLTLAAGLGAGVLIASLLPKRISSTFAKRAMGAATVAAELGLSLSRQAREAAGDAANYASDAAHDGLALLEETTAPLIKRADSAGKSARSQGTRLATEAIKLASRLRR